MQPLKRQRVKAQSPIIRSSKRIGESPSRDLFAVPALALQVFSEITKASLLNRDAIVATIEKLASLTNLGAEIVFDIREIEKIPLFLAAQFYSLSKSLGKGSRVTLLVNSKQAESEISRRLQANVLIRKTD